MHEKSQCCTVVPFEFEYVFCIVFRLVKLEIQLSNSFLNNKLTYLLMLYNG